MQISTQIALFTAEDAKDAELFMVAPTAQPINNRFSQRPLR